MQYLLDKMFLRENGVFEQMRTPCNEEQNIHQSFCQLEVGICLGCVLVNKLRYSNRERSEMKLACGYFSTVSMRIIQGA